jgi:hypothetical protein
MASGHVRGVLLVMGAAVAVAALILLVLSLTDESTGVEAPRQLSESAMILLPARAAINRVLA